MTIAFWILWAATVLLDLMALVWMITHLCRHIYDWFFIRTGEICFRKGCGPKIVPIRIMRIRR